MKVIVKDSSFLKVKRDFPALLSCVVCQCIHTACISLCAYIHTYYYMYCTCSTHMCLHFVLCVGRIGIEGVELHTLHNCVVKQLGYDVTQLQKM